MRPWRREKANAPPAGVTEVAPPAASGGSGAELGLSNLGQLELLRGVMERGARFRSTVRGVSMSPFVRDGDVLTIAPMNRPCPRMGDIVAFVEPHTGRLAIHRVIARDVGGWRLAGDNCEKTDGMVPLHDILGKVVCIERRGREVRLGLGVERSWIAALNRGGHLMRLRKLLRGSRLATGVVLRLMHVVRSNRSAVR